MPVMDVVQLKTLAQTLYQQAARQARTDLACALMRRADEQLDLHTKRVLEVLASEFGAVGPEELL